MAVLIAHNMDVRVFAQIAFPVAGAGNYRTAVAVGAEGGIHQLLGAAVEGENHNQVAGGDGLGDAHHDSGVVGNHGVHIHQLELEAEFIGDVVGQPAGKDVDSPGLLNHLDAPQHIRHGNLLDGAVRLHQGFV